MHNVTPTCFIQTEVQLLQALYNVWFFLSEHNTNETQSQPLLEHLSKSYQTDRIWGVPSQREIKK